MSFQGKVDILAEDPPYNIRHEAGRPRFSFDVFRKKNVGDLHDLAEFTLCPGGNGLLFFSRVRFLDRASKLKNGRKRYLPTMTLLKRQSEEETFSVFTWMVLSTSGTPEAICNIHRDVSCIISTWPSKP